MLIKRTACRPGQTVITTGGERAVLISRATGESWYVQIAGEAGLHVRRIRVGLKAMGYRPVRNGGKTLATDERAA